MQAVVDRIIRAFTSRRALPDQQGKSAHEEAAELAVELLESYKSRLARRTLSTASH